MRWVPKVGSDQWIRWSTSAVVVAVAGFAAVQSYTHIYDLALACAQSRLDAQLLPLCVDGMILAASLVMLHEARQGRGMPWLAPSLLGLGVVLTIAANVESGLPHGWLAAVLSAVPAVMFVGSAELVILLVKRTSEASPGPGPGEVSSLVATDAETAAAAAFAASVSGGNPFTQNALKTRFRLTREQAKAIMNGHGG